MHEFSTLVEAIAAAAAAWRDPEHPARAEAVQKTLKAPNRFTEEEIAFTVNQQMSVLQPEAIRAWIAGRQARRTVAVGVLSAGEVPLAGLEDFLAVLLVGHRYRGALPPASPHLLPAFTEEVQRRAPNLPVSFVERAEDVIEASKAVIAYQNQIPQAGSNMLPEQRLLRRAHFAVAVIDGSESADEREGLAEDMLLHDSRGQRSVRLLFAPAGLDPDPYLEAMAAFRAVFPAHPDLPGALQMQQAFLDAAGQPHAYAEGLPFLVSRGAPEVQRPGHVRWSAYDDLGDVRAWLTNNTDRASLLVVRHNLARRLSGMLPFALPGAAHRPSLGGWHAGRDVVDFLVRIGDGRE